ncbi:MAG TPA: copper amine oxidase N-terminal domain-containing protein [bacterium]|nr:copper amine oxidase N-terminal domain-containing protein [bacterium]
MRINRLERAFVSAILIGVVAAGLASAAAAQTVAPYVKVVVDGSPIYLDAPPMIVNGRVLVPLRGVFERLGATVIWDPASQTVRAQNGPTGVALTVGASQAFVNGQPQPLDTPALLVGGRTMVPLRFISQALGANVSWDAATYTVQIASQGTAAPPVSVPPSVSYPPGQAAPAPYPAPAPPQPAPPAVQTITGTVTQANASVYPGQLTVQTPNGLTYTYQIVSGTTITRVNPANGLNAPIAFSTIQPGDAVTVTGDPSGTAQSVQALNYAPAPQGAPQAPAPPGAQTITGAVTEVNASAYPGQLIVQASNGTVYTYRIVSGTTITRTNTTTGLGGPVSLSAVQAGDAATVAADPTGTAQSVQASYAEINGTIASAGTNQIALQDGHTYMLAPTAQVMRDGQVIPPAALQPGGAVTLRVNPATGLVYGVILRQAAVPGVITAVTVTPAGRQLVAGDVMTVVATGPARGTGTFAIAGLRSGLPMTESATQPGTYVGTYAVQPGDTVANGSVVVSLTAPGGQVLTATAPAPVSIYGSAAPSPAAGPPVILSPTPGTSVTTPFTVTGAVPPGSKVRVTADYNKNVVGFNWHGTLGSQTVTADANGRWSATFTQKPPVLGVNLTITAVLVDNTGAVRSAPATVTTTLQ